MVRMYAKLHKSMEILEYFTTRSWEWTHGHLDMLKSQMTPEDQKVSRMCDKLFLSYLFICVCHNLYSLTVICIIANAIKVGLLDYT